MNPKSALGTLAVKSLMKNDQDMTYEKAQQKVQRQSYDEIARKSNCLVSVSVASTSYALDFGLTEKERQEFLDECLGRTNLTRISDSMTDVVSSPLFNRDKMIDVIVSAASAVHDSWRYEQAENKFPTSSVKEFQYLPIAFIGVNEMLKDLKYVEAVQSQIDFPYQQFQATNSFQVSSANMIAYGIEMYGDLPTYIAECMKQDPHIAPDIKKQFEDVEWIKETIIPQLMDYGFGRDEMTMHVLNVKGVTLEDSCFEPKSIDEHNRDDR